MSIGPMIGYISAALVGALMIYYIYEAARKGEYHSMDFWGSIIGLLAVIIMPIALTIHGKSKKESKA